MTDLAISSVALGILAWDAWRRYLGQGTRAVRELTERVGRLEREAESVRTAVGLRKR